MFPIHLSTMLRMCGAITLPGQASGLRVMINNLIPAVEGDRDSHDNLGMLINILQHNVLIGGMPAIPSIVSGAAPDILGIIPHVQGFPIPIGGSPNVMIGQGSMMAMLGLGTNFQVGELLSIGQQIIGTITSVTQVSSSSSVLKINNLSPGVSVSPGQTVVGDTSGSTMKVSVVADSRPGSYPSFTDVSNTSFSNTTTGGVTVTTTVDAIVIDTGENIVLQDYFDYYPSINLTAALVTT